MATANMALNRPRGPALIPPKTPPGTTTQPPTQPHSARPCLLTRAADTAHLLFTKLIYLSIGTIHVSNTAREGM